MTASARVKFIYNFCNDLETVRRFYTELVGLEETSFANDKGLGWLNYRFEGFEFMFFREDDERLPVSTEFAAQPGGGGGTRLATSWTIEVPEETFPDVVARIQAAKVPCNQANPVWLQESYWGFVVLDPAGNTVELCCYPKERPQSAEWNPARIPC